MIFTCLLCLSVTMFFFRSLYDNPQPSSESVDEVAVKFISAIKGKLRSKSMDPIFTINMDHDISRYLFSGKGSPSNVSGAVLLEKNDFERMPLLTESWWYCLNRIGEGREVDFPLRAKPILRKFSQQSGIYIFSISSIGFPWE